MYGALVTLPVLHLLYGNKYRSMLTSSAVFAGIDIYECKKQHRSFLTRRPLYQAQTINKIPKFQSRNDTFTKLSST
jgi:hypothetical protein